MLKGGNAIKAGDEPDIPYSYDAPSDYDKTCGTFGLDTFQLPHPECPDRFVCDVPEDNQELAQFSDCIESMNCHMVAGMTTNVQADNPAALFMHQMIPHHQNAVNMAKALLKTGILVCDDMENPDETDDCSLTSMLFEIINGQNVQIQTMRRILKNQFPDYPTDHCNVNIPAINAKTSNVPKNEARKDNPSKS